MLAGAALEASIQVRYLRNKNVQDLLDVTVAHCELRTGELVKLGIHPAIYDDVYSIQGLVRDHDQLG